MNSFECDENRIKTLATVLREMEYHPDGFEELTPFNDDRYRELHFLFFLTLIDHNTHGVQRYEEVVEGKLVHGSELMYLLAQRRGREDRDFFTPPRLKAVSDAAIREVFSSDGKVPAGIEERAALIREAAALLCSRYRCDLGSLLSLSEGYLRRQDGHGLFDLLGEFRGYSDPLQKKIFLLVKLLRRRGLVQITDPQHLNVPVDHVLFTIALRSGMLVPEESLARQILARSPLDQDCVVALRNATLQAYRRVAELSGVPVDHFDDLLWAYGRECLRVLPPFPEEKIEEVVLPLNDRIENQPAWRQFIRIINGLDFEAPERSKLFPVPLFAPNYFF